MDSPPRRTLSVSPLLAPLGDPPLNDTPDPAALSQFLYRMSLEHPARWWMLIGPGLETEPPYLSIANLRSFTIGFQEGHAFGRTRAADPFFTWIRDEAGAFPQEGWEKHFLQRAEGQHQRAITMLFEYLHRYLLETRPAWFVRFNQLPQESIFANGLGSTLAADVRLPAHVMAVTGAEAITLPDIRVEAFEMTDGYSLKLGLPGDVATWWGGAGRRVVLLDSQEHLDAVRGDTKPAPELMRVLRSMPAAAALDACIVDATPEGVTVLCTGRVGAVHVREHRTIALTEPDTGGRWELRSGDRVLLLSEALFVMARELGVGPLSAALATGEPIAWAQAIKAPVRRLAVAVSKPARAGATG